MTRPDIKTLERFNAYYKPDTAFASHARLLQSKWRTKKGFPQNQEVKENYGNFIETGFAVQHRANFLTDNIKGLVTKKIKEIRKNGGLVGEPRIWNNLLSSQPLCFNLFGELYYDLELATQFFQRIFPGEVTKVTKIDFEYSTKRGNPDNSAFDVYVEYEKGEELKFWGIEVKYQEKLQEEDFEKSEKIFESHKAAYTRLTSESKYFKENVLGQLIYPPYSQIWRVHLLSFNMSDNERSGSFIFLYPFENDECNKGVMDYKSLLCSSDEKETRFYPRDLALFINTLAEMHNAEWTRELKKRYLGD